MMENTKQMQDATELNVHKKEWIEPMMESFSIELAGGDGGDLAGESAS
ncbi:hypothetical protein [Cellulophaga sp. BC115SP]|nr:hypothetical protein [Cellulophaga sp. BC115SP]NBB31663.1 hypothetical protein [Cellulophaga sp. BC115SP]